ncbi:restriction endonuclease subunit S [Tenacibaculum finnmarkense]|uniref:restriction endonuclease subunit S n=1 Tax=Tenacibaculum finnmarkense TaxID=2781243 RepID=UPI001EFB7F21|nr:restriction endonuclease subunit S [Tenacibaculum finnmarkense]MCG8900716.1 restriction endonuclease subunit S [Tenacibaculum finnmarkense]
MSLSIKNIPSDWELKNLGEIGETYSGLSGKTKVDFGRGKPYITYMNIYSNPKLKIDFTDFVEINKSENQNSVKYGDIFFTTSSETPDEVGMSSVLLNKVDELYLNSFCFGFRMFNFNTLLPEYAVYLLRGEKSRKIISILAQGSTRFNLSKITLLKRLTLALPPLKEQQKIAEILSTVDAKISIIDEQISENQNLKKGLMQSLLSKGIGHTEFKKSALGEIPKSWEVVKIQDIADVNKESLANSTDKNYELFYIDLSSVKSGVIDLPTEKIKFSDAPSRARRKIKKDDVIMATVRPNLLGYGYIDFKENDYFVSTGFVVLSYKENFNGRFLYQYLYSEVMQLQIEKLIVGSSYPAINSSDVKHMKIPLPPLQEQQKIASILNSVDEKLGVLSEKKSYYQNLKKGLMQQLLTGKVRVSV